MRAKKIKLILRKIIKIAATRAGPTSKRRGEEGMGWGQTARGEEREGREGKGKEGREGEGKEGSQSHPPPSKKLDPPLHNTS